MSRWRAALFVALQYLTPQHLLSRWVGRLARARWRPWKDCFIGWFVRRYHVDMSEAAVSDPRAYADFNQFFTRALRPGARLLAPEPALLCPADGTLSQFGSLAGDRIFQAKGHDFSAATLLGDPDLAAPFADGDFATVYLSPRDYHRVHMPLAGSLRQMVAIPGALFSVNAVTTERVPGLFARNERVACVFDTALGPMAVVLVGAMIVASVQTVWAGTVVPRSGRVSREDYPAGAIHLERGAELGRFLLGSTVVMLLPKGAVNWRANLAPAQGVRLGEDLGALRQV